MRRERRKHLLAELANENVTAKQVETLRAIQEMSAATGYPPTLDELGERFGIDRTSVNHRIVSLLGKGCVTRTGGPRTLVLTEKGRAALEAGHA